MRSSILAVLGLVLASQTLRAQDLHVAVHSTYQAPIGGLTEAQEDWFVSTDTMRYAIRTAQNLNWGRGSGYGASVSYALSELLAVELRTTHVPGTPIRWTNTYRGGSTDHELRSRYFLVQPAVRLSMKRERITYHVAVGPSFILDPRSTWSRHDIPDGTLPWNTDVRQTTVTSGGWGSGGFVNAGASYAITARWGAFAELGCAAQSWAPRRGRLTEFTQDGVDMLPAQSTSDTHVEYEDSYSTLDSYDPDEPSKALRTRLPMSTWGVCLGIRCALGKKEGR